MTEANNNTETNKLDNLTVRRFARLFKNDGTKTSSPITTGTVAQNGNSLIVYADGAMIPITQTSTGVNVGDEVTVIYGDDQAYIVGNNTDNSPTASDLMNAEINAERAAAELIRRERAKIDAKTDTVRQKAQDASNKADALEKELDASNATITDLSTEVGTLGERIENSIKTASETYATKTEVRQTAVDIKTEVERDYTNDLGEKLKQYSTTEQTATYIQDTLSTNYYTKGEIEESYVSESQLTQKANEITSSVKEDIASEYATTKALSEVKQTADGVSQTLTREYTKTGKDTNYTQQSTFKQTVEGLEASIKSTGDDAKKVATNYLSYTSSGGLVVGNMTASTLAGNTQITSTGVNVRKGTTTLGSFTGSTITLGKTASGNNNTYIDTNGIQFRNGSTALASFTSSSSTIGKTSSNNVVVDTSGMTIKNGTTALASFTADKITMGKTSGINAQVDNDSFDVCSGATPYISMGYTSADGAMISSLNKMPLNLSTACNINGDGTWSELTRSGHLSSWVERECSYGGWHLTTYIPQSGQSYFYAEIIYSGSGSGTVVQTNYPSTLHLKIDKPNHASVSTRQEGTPSSYAGWVYADTDHVSFYPSNTTGTSGTTPFTVFVAGYFTNTKS